MKYYAKDLIAIAVAELGYLEKASNGNLDDKTANAGSGNWTKYGRDLKNAGYYAGMSKNGYAWCDQFVDWCFLKLCGNRKTAEWLECQTGDYGAGCIYSKQYYAAQNRIFTTPQAGDQVFFKSNGEVCHTGIVEAVNGNTITTIEGNSSDRVERRNYTLGNGYIDSFGRPKYDTEAGAIPSIPSPIVSNMLRMGDAGEAVREMQTMLIAMGYSCGPDGADGDFGAATYNAVIKYQTQKGLEVDGIVGAQTITSIKNNYKMFTGNTATPSPIINTNVDAEIKIWDFLSAKFGNAYAVAGIMGNLRAESDLNSKNLQNSYQRILGFTDETYTQAIDKNTYANFIHDRAGYGIAQWTFWKRKERLAKFAQMRGTSIGDLDMQLNFLCDEMNEDYLSVLKELVAVKSVRQASDIVLTKYEQPADQTETEKTKRANYAQEYFDKYHNRPVSVATTIEPKKSIQIGDVVNFTGTRHFVAANGLVGLPCKSGRAKVTKIAEGARHPYHLVSIGSGSTVYGWVSVEDVM